MHLNDFLPYLCRMNFRINWDALGISASLACAIHCALLPLILNSLPIFGINIIHNTFFEYFMILLAMGIGYFSLWHGYKRHHHSLQPLLLFSAGVAFLWAKEYWSEHENWMLAAALPFIVVAHLRNHRSCRVHNHAHSEDCNH